jgi:small-conductance mechanosensitive channel
MPARMPQVSLPEWLSFLEASALGAPLWHWLVLALGVPVALTVGWLVARLLLGVLRRVAARTAATWDDELVALLAGPVRFGAFAVALRSLYELVRLEGRPQVLAAAGGRVLFGISLAYFAWKLVDLAVRAIEKRSQAESVDAQAARGIRTRAQVIGQVLHVAVVIVAIGLVLVQFDVVRSLGVSVLASAGAASLVLGLAAQRSLGSVFAGLQLSFTQPVRVGDVVVVENEWGTVEEIRLTYALVQLWDERRLVVPLTTFLDRPFVNWTRKPSDLVGIVLLFVDYTADVAAIRAEMLRFLEAHPAWNKRVGRCIVFDCTERTVQLRLTASAEVTKVFDLRAELREHMLAWIRAQAGGAWLPRTRVEDGGAVRAGAGVDGPDGGRAPVSGPAAGAAAQAAPR